MRSCAIIYLLHLELETALIKTFQELTGRLDAFRTVRRLSDLLTLDFLHHQQSAG